MSMILNDVLTKQNVLTKILLKDGDKELPKELKVKIMRIRMIYAKIKKGFDNESQEFAEELMKGELTDLRTKVNKSEEDQLRMQELIEKINSEYQEFLAQKGNEDVGIIEDSLTIEEYSEILEVNAGNDVEINTNKIKAADFLEIVYDLFVKE